MKKIEQIREQYNLITEKEEAETRKLTSLVRAGLFDPKKLPMLKRALNKDPKDMTPAERKILIELLDSLMGEVLQSQQIYSKVKQNVMMKEETIEEAKTFDGYYSKYDPRYTKMPTEREIPTIIILKRKAIRVYPDNQKVALYYSQALDKYVTIPFGTFDGGTVNEAVKPRKLDPDDKDKQQALRNRIAAAQALRDKNTAAAAQKEKVNSLTTELPAKSEKENKLNKKPQDPENKEKVAEKRKKELYDRKLTSKMDIGRAKVTMKNDPDINFATRVGAIAGLSARRSFENSKVKQVYNKVKSSYKIAKNQAKNINTTFEETEIKKSFKNKLNEKREYGAIDTAADIASMAPGPIGSAASLASAGLSLSRGDYVGAALDVAGALPGVGYAAKGAKLARKADKVTDAVKGAEKAIDASKVTKPGTSVPSVPKKPAEPVKEPTKPVEAPAGAAPKKPGFIRRAGRRLAKGAAIGAGLALSGLAGAGKGATEKKFSQPKDSQLQVKLNKPVGNVRTGIEARDTNLYRKTMQQNESVLNVLYSLNENEEKTVEIANESVVINNTVAKKIIGLYESVNKNNKEKIETMLNESVDSFKKIASFAARQ